MDLRNMTAISSFWLSAGHLHPQPRALALHTVVAELDSVELKVA